MTPSPDNFLSQHFQMNLNGFRATGCHYKSLAGAQKPPFSCRLFHQCVASLFPSRREVFQQVAYPAVITLHPCIAHHYHPQLPLPPCSQLKPQWGWKVNTGKWERRPHGYELVKRGFGTICPSVFQTVCLAVWKTHFFFCLQSDSERIF